jgi:hypothetical protein
MSNARNALLLVAMIFVVAPVLGQDAQQPPTIFMTSWQCDRAAVDGLIESMKTRDMVIAQELVEEGALWSYHVMVHDWGDEWNFVTLLVATDIASGVAANDAFNDRFEARFGEDDTFIEHCKTHRDNIYVGTYITQAPEGQNPQPPYSVAVSYFACPINEIDGIIAAARETFLPAAQASVNAGMGYMTGGMRHAWADEWNYIIFRAAADVPGLIAHARDTAERITSDAPGPTLSCAHKDNIYRMVLETTPSSQ